MPERPPTHEHALHPRLKQWHRWDVEVEIVHLLYHAGRYGGGAHHIIPACCIEKRPEIDSSPMTSTSAALSIGTAAAAPRLRAP